MKSTKHEIRSTKRIQDSNDKNSKYLGFKILNVGIVSDFNIRISDFLKDLLRISIFGFRYSALRLQGGQAMFIAALFFLLISMTIVLGAVQPVLSGLTVLRSVQKGAESLYAAESVAEDVRYRLRKGLAVDAVETFALLSARAVATTSNVFDGKEVAAAGDSGGYIRKSTAHLIFGTGANFNFGMQSGDGGIFLENTSSITGNAHSSGPIDGAGNNLIRGDAVSAGPSGLVEGVHATSSVYAHTISNATVDKDAYYQTISHTTIGGVSYPGSADQATSSLPISDVQIAAWESDAEAGGVISSPCPYRIEADASLGPKKITCDLEIIGNPTVTLGGVVWVTGNITVKNTAVVKVASSLGAASVPVIADNPANQTTSSKFSLENSAVFQGSGSPGSYVLLVSQNRSAEQGGGEKAIDAKNSVDGDLLLYAGHGEILLQNSIEVKEVTAWRIRLKNSAEVIYETGLANLLFASGPSGGYVFDRWREIE